MPRLIRNMDSIFDLEDELLGSGNGSGNGCCIGGNSNLRSGLESIPVPTAQEIIDVDIRRVMGLDNLTKRMYSSIRDDSITPEDFILFAKVVKNKKLSIENYPGLGVAMMSRLHEMSTRQDNTPKEVLMLERSLDFLLAASNPEICSSQLDRLSMVGVYTFEDYGSIVMENIK